MQYWRMQLHPNEPENATRHAAESLASGFIGLDFGVDPGDLLLTTKASLPQGQKDYWAFAHDMQVGDKVLVIVHHLPFALAVVAGDYNYMRTPAPELGVWFRHFRRIERPAQYYGDKITDAHRWERLVMTDTISPLTDPKSASYQLIDTW